MRVEIFIDGEEWRDLELALEEVLERIRKEYVSGHDQNETGSYTFTVEQWDTL